MKFKCFVFVLFFATSFTSCLNNLSDNEGAELRRVVRVIDGDTFVVDDGTKKGEKVRLIGIDTPEIRKSKNKDVEYYGKEAKQYLVNLLSDAYVVLEYDVNITDRYGRTLAYVYLKDGTFVNAELVKNGYAKVMTIPPNVKFSELFVKLQREARENYLGLWKQFED